MLSSKSTTPVNPLGMAMYALAVNPLINKLLELLENTSQVWFADDATAASTCQQLCTWWDDLLGYGPSFGYYPKAYKTLLVVKEEYAEEAERAFAGTSVNKPHTVKAPWCNCWICGFQGQVCVWTGKREHRLLQAAGCLSD